MSTRRRLCCVEAPQYDHVGIAGGFAWVNRWLLAVVHGRISVLHWHMMFADECPQVSGSCASIASSTWPHGHAPACSCMHACKTQVITCYTAPECIPTAVHMLYSYVKLPCAKESCRAYVWLQPILKRTCHPQQAAVKWYVDAKACVAGCRHSMPYAPAC